MRKYSGLSPSSRAPLRSFLSRAAGTITSAPRSIPGSLATSCDIAIVTVRIASIVVVVALEFSSGLLAPDLGMPELLAVGALDLAPFDLLGVVPWRE